MTSPCRATGHLWSGISALIAWLWIASPATGGEYVVVDVDRLPVMDAAKEIASFPRGSALEITKSNGNWGQVEFVEGGVITTGWVDRRRVKPYRFRVTSPAFLMVDKEISDSRQNVRLAVGSLVVIEGIKGTRVQVTLSDGIKTDAILQSELAPYQHAVNRFDVMVLESQKQPRPYRARARLTYHRIALERLLRGSNLPGALWEETPRITDDQIASLIERMEADARRSVTLSPKDPEGHVLLGIALSQRGKDQEAIESFTEAESNNGDPYEVLMNRATSRQRIDDIVGAAQDFQRVRPLGTSLLPLQQLGAATLFKLHRVTSGKEEAAYQAGLAAIAEAIRVQSGIAAPRSEQRYSIDDLMTIDPLSDPDQWSYPMWDRLRGYDPNAWNQLYLPELVSRDVARKNRLSVFKSRRQALGLGEDPRIVALQSSEKVFLCANTGRTDEALTLGRTLSRDEIDRGWELGSMLLSLAMDRRDSEMVTRRRSKKEPIAEDGKEPNSSFADIVKNGGGSGPVSDAGDRLRLPYFALAQGRPEFFQTLVESNSGQILRAAAQTDPTGRAALFAGWEKLLSREMDEGVRLIRDGLLRDEAIQKARRDHLARAGQATEVAFSLYRGHPGWMLSALAAGEYSKLDAEARTELSRIRFSNEAVLGLGRAYDIATPTASSGKRVEELRDGRTFAIYQLAAGRQPAHATSALEHLVNFRRLRTRSESRFSRRPISPAEALLKEFIGQHSALHSFRMPSSDVPPCQEKADWLLARVSEEMSGQLSTVYQQSIGTRTIEDVENDSVGWRPLDEIQRQLGPRQVAIEFLKGRTVDVEQLPQGYQLTDPLYGAWIVRATGEPKFVDLGPAQTIDSQIAAVHSLMKEAPATWRNEAKTNDLNRALRRLAELVLDSADIPFSDVDELIVVPDGELWLVPWSGLVLRDGRSLVEMCSVTARFTLGDLAEAPGPDDAVYTAPVIVADPDCSASPEAIRQAEREVAGEPYTDLVKLSVPGSQPRFAAFGDLPATRDEALAIAPHLQKLTGQTPQLLMRERALESQVKRLQAPEFLVFSTHGYFVPAPDSGQRSNPQGRDGLDQSYPLLRGGIVLAGANRCHEWGEARGCDGILTSHEAAFLNLRNTRLVALSGCETGLGDLPYGEGVAGLKQAFFLAGARSVLASLWSIDDRATADLMAETFRRMSSGRTSAAALREAQLDQIRSRRERYGNAHPLFWAAWTLTVK